jgi:hypothetical protein
MTSAVVGQTIARANRNRLIYSIVGVLAVIAFGAISYRYFYNFFLGPFPTTLEELSAANGPGDLFKYYVTVDGSRSIDTGFQMEHRRNGSVTSTDNYLALDLGKRLLLVQSPDVVVSIKTSYTGYLETSDSEVQTKVIDDIEASDPALKGIFLPMQLTDSDFKFSGYLGLVAAALVLGLSLWGIFGALQRSSDPGRHPIAKALGRFGDPSMAISAIDSELMVDHPKVGNLHLAPTWLVHQQSAALSATRFEDIAWIYKLVTTHRTNGIRTGKTYTAQIWDRHGVAMIIPGKEDLVNQMLNAVVQRAPWALAGHSAEIEQAWKSNRAAVVAAVDQRRQQIRAAS